MPSRRDVLRMSTAGVLAGLAGCSASPLARPKLDLAVDNARDTAVQLGVRFLRPHVSERSEALVYRNNVEVPPRDDPDDLWTVEDVAPDRPYRSRSRSEILGERITITIVRTVRTTNRTTSASSSTSTREAGLRSPRRRAHRTVCSCESAIRRSNVIGPRERKAEATTCESVLDREAERSATPRGQLLPIPTGIDHRVTIGARVGERISAYADDPVPVDATFVTALGTVERRLVGGLALGSGCGGRHSHTFAPDGHNHVVLRPSLDPSPTRV